MPNRDIFCNSPWYELQIYWDGSLGFCCQEDHKVYANELANKYNIKNMSIQEWFDSEPMRQARMDMFGNNKLSYCRRCYHEEAQSGTSRRHRSNQKSVIFTKQNFNESFEQSPGHNKFQQSCNSAGSYSGLPIDLHIDLGNYCNLTCKMCGPRASSKIASQYIQWGINEAKQYALNDWTKDQAVWERTLDEISKIPNLKNIHFMGGETLITKRFEDFVNFMIERKRFDLNFSFVTNGTTFNSSLIEKLLKFDRVGIEVSIETMTDHNSYQRQGSDMNVIKSNIEKYQTYCDGSRITLTMRPALSALTIGNYHTLLDYCLVNNYVVKCLLVTNPKFYDVRILPTDIKNLYKQKFTKFLIDHNLTDIEVNTDYNESDPHQIKKIIKQQVDQCITLLSTPQPNDAEVQLQQMVTWCKRWDQVHGYNARELYPEFRPILDRYEY